MILQTTLNTQCRRTYQDPTDYRHSPVLRTRLQQYPSCCSRYSISGPIKRNQSNSLNHHPALKLLCHPSGRDHGLLPATCTSTFTVIPPTSRKFEPAHVLVALPFSVTKIGFRQRQPARHRLSTEPFMFIHPP